MLHDYPVRFTLRGPFASRALLASRKHYSLREHRSLREHHSLRETRSLREHLSLRDIAAGTRCALHVASGAIEWGMRQLTSEKLLEDALSRPDLMPEAFYWLFAPPPRFLFRC